MTNSRQGEWLQLFRERHVLKEGHFLLTSGRHSAQYLQCALLFQWPDEAERAGKAMAEPFLNEKIDVVIGPAIGGIVAAHEVARALGARALFVERENGAMTLRRGFHLEKGERVIVVEDVVTTGGSVNETIAVVERFGADIVGIASVVDRSGTDTPFKYPFRPLVKMAIDTYAPDACPLCHAGMEPPVKPGSRSLQK